MTVKAVIGVSRIPEHFSEKRVYIPTQFHVICPAVKIDKDIEVVYLDSALRVEPVAIPLGYVRPADEAPDVYEYHYDGCTQIVGCLQAVCRSIHRMAEHTYNKPRKEV